MATAAGPIVPSFATTSRTRQGATAHMITGAIIAERTRAMATTADQLAEKLTEAQRVLLIKTVLAVTGTEPQRRAFIDGYNGFPCPPKASAQMRERHKLGGQVQAVLSKENEQ